MECSYSRMKHTVLNPLQRLCSLNTTMWSHPLRECICLSIKSWQKMSKLSVILWYCVSNRAKHHSCCFLASIQHITPKKNSLTWVWNAQNWTGGVFRANRSALVSLWETGRPINVPKTLQYSRRDGRSQRGIAALPVPDGSWQWHDSELAYTQDECWLKHVLLVWAKLLSSISLHSGWLPSSLPLFDCE